MSQVSQSSNGCLVIAQVSQMSQASPRLAGRLWVPVTRPVGRTTEEKKLKPLSRPVGRTTEKKIRKPLQIRWANYWKKNPKTPPDPLGEPLKKTDPYPADPLSEPVLKNESPQARWADH